MKRGKPWTALAVTAVAAAATLTAGGTAWASGPTGHARPAAASSHLTVPPRGGAAACALMMRGHPDMGRLPGQMMRGSPSMAAMSREMMGSGVASMMDPGRPLERNRPRRM